MSEPTSSAPAAATLGSGLALLFSGAWFLVFPRLVSVPGWMSWMLDSISFFVVLLSLLLIGSAVGSLIAGRGTKK